MRDSGAPNRTLADWLRPGKIDPPVKTLDQGMVSSALQGEKRDLLDLVSVRLTDEVKSEVGQLKHVAWLRLPSSTGATDLPWVGQLTCLRGLSLSSSDLTGGDLRVLSSLQSIQWLELYGIQMSSDDFATLPRFARLETLSLGGCKGTDERIRHLVSLDMPSLRTLVLWCSDVSDVGVGLLSRSWSLEYLDVYRARGVTDRSVEAIGAMKTLRVLGVGGTGIAPSYSPTPAARRLSEMLPRCRIDVGG